MGARLRKIGLRLLLGSVFLAYLIHLAHPYISGEDIAQSVQHMHMGFAAEAFLLYLLLTVIRGWRFRIVGAQLSPSSAFGLASIHSALLRVLPFRLGELAYGLLLRKEDGGGLGIGTATILLLRGFDFVVFIPLAALSAGLLLNWPWWIGGAAALLIFVLLLGLLLALGPLSRRLSTVLTTLRPKPWTQRGMAWMGTLEDVHRQALGKQWPLLGVTLAHWTVLLLWFALIFRVFGVRDGHMAMAASVSGVLGSFLPLSLVGTFGPMEGGLAAGLLALGKTGMDAATLSISVSGFSLFCNVAVGLVAIPFYFRRLRSRRDGLPEKSSAFMAWEVVLFALLGGALLLFRIPYGFESGDQVHYLLLPYREMFAPFLTGDWFTWQTTHTHLTFSWLIQGIYWMSGESMFPVGVFVAHFMVLGALAGSLFHLSRVLGFGWGGAVFAVCSLAFLRQEGIASALVNHGMLLSADMALPPYLLAVAFALERRWWWAGIALGVSGFLHVNYAILGMATVLPWVVFNGWKAPDFKALGKLVLPWVLLSAPNLIYLLLGFLTTDAAGAGVDVFFDVRSPHHYKPDVFHYTGFWWMLWAVVFSVPAWIKGDTRIRQNLRFLVLWLVFFQLLAYLAMVFDLQLLTRLFLWRLSLPLLLLGCLLLGGMVLRYFRDGRTFHMAYATLGLAGFLALGTAGNAFPKALPAVMTGAHWERAMDRLTPLTMPSLSGIAEASKQKRLHQWIRKNTPENALFLIPPGLADFRLGTRRGVFVDWKCCPMRGDDILEWQRRMLGAMGTSSFPVTGYRLSGVSSDLFNRRSLGDLEALARNEGLSHVLVKNSAKFVPAGLEQMVRLDAYTVYRVKTNLPQ